MKNNKIYVVKILVGSPWESCSYIEFVTENKTYAENWVKKFNTIVDKWRTYFEYLMNNKNDFIMNSNWAFERWEQFKDLDGAIIQESELR